MVRAVVGGVEDPEDGVEEVVEGVVVEAGDSRGPWLRRIVDLKGRENEG